MVEAEVERKRRNLSWLVGDLLLHFFLAFVFLRLGWARGRCSQLFLVPVALASTFDFRVLGVHALRATSRLPFRSHDCLIFRIHVAGNRAGCFLRLTIRFSPFYLAFRASQFTLHAS